MPSSPVTRGNASGGEANQPRHFPGSWRGSAQAREAPGVSRGEQRRPVVGPAHGGQNCPLLRVLLMLSLLVCVPGADSWVTQRRSCTMIPAP